jgi:hypothetical protein
LNVYSDSVACLTLEEFIMARKLFWYKTCPFCNQGRLFIFKNLNLNKLYLHCEECERGYYDPDEFNVESSFLTLTEDFDAIEATSQDIKAHNWDKFHLNISIE